MSDVFIPCPENLLVNLHEQFELIKDLLEQIPEKFKESYDTNCALGAALQAAHKLMVLFLLACYSHTFSFRFANE